MRSLDGKKIVLGVTGGIAAYKSADLASRLVRAGASVYVVMTREAQHFITPLTFQALTANPVTTDIFDPTSDFAIQHIGLARMAQGLVIAPATANIIAKLATGIADEALTVTVLAASCPILLAPAMESHMYENPATQANLARLRERGFHIVGPGYGRLASGGEGWGRMEEPQTILEHLCWVLGRGGDLAGRKIVVTAGGTQEPLDPVRHLTNPSSGKMGYALAEAARDRGASVVLISAPTSLTPPVGVEVVSIRTAQEMKAAVERAVAGAHALIMAAAVADFRPKETSAQKIKKAGREELVLELEATPDILKEVQGDFLKVGFAAESQDLIRNATQKLREKSLHLIVANDITSPGSGFASDTNRVTLLDREGKVEELPLLPKLEVAHIILDRVAGYVKESNIAKREITFVVPRPRSKGRSVPVWIENGFIHIPRDKLSFFPPPRTRFWMETDIGKLPVILRDPDNKNIRGEIHGLKDWYAAHPELKVGSKLKIAALEPGRRYRLSIEQL